MDITRLVNQMLPAPDGESAVRHRTGTVLAVNADGTVDLDLGDTTVSGSTVPDVATLAGAGVAVGDVVQVAAWAGDLLVLGRVSEASQSWVAWTPALTGSVSNPNIGSTGTTTGRYVRTAQDLIVAHGRVTFGGTGIADGSGNYLISLPVAASASGASGDIVGEGYILDSSTARFLLVFERSTSTTAILVYNNTAATNVVTDALPVAAYAAGDSFRFNLHYEAAPV